MRREWLCAVVGRVLVPASVVFAFWLRISMSSKEPASSGGEVASASGRIAFYSDRDGDREIYVMNADGSGVVRLGEGLYLRSLQCWNDVRPRGCVIPVAKDICTGFWI